MILLMKNTLSKFFSNFSKKNSIPTIFVNHLIYYPTPKNLKYIWSFGSLAGIFFALVFFDFNYAVGFFGLILFFKIFFNFLSSLKFLIWRIFFPIFIVLFFFFFAVFFSFLFKETQQELNIIFPVENEISGESLYDENNKLLPFFYIEHENSLCSLKNGCILDNVYWTHYFQHLYVFSFSFDEDFFLYQKAIAKFKREEAEAYALLCQKAQAPFDINLYSDNVYKKYRNKKLPHIHWPLHYANLDILGTIDGWKPMLDEWENVYNQASQIESTEASTVQFNEQNNTIIGVDSRPPHTRTPGYNPNASPIFNIVNQRFHQLIFGKK